MVSTAICLSDRIMPLKRGIKELLRESVSATKITPKFMLAEKQSPLIGNAENVLSIKQPIPKAMQKRAVKRQRLQGHETLSVHGCAARHIHAIDVLDNTNMPKSESQEKIYARSMSETAAAASIVTLIATLQSAIVSRCSSLRKASRLTVLRTCLSNAVLATASSITPFIPLRGNGSSFAWSKA